MRFRTSAGLAFILCFSGCGGEKKEMPETAPVSGTVTYNGSPVTGATVSLLSTSDGKPATGVSDSSGAFTVTTFVSGADEAPGAVPGEYKVTVTKFPSANMTPEQMAERMQSGGKMEPPKNELPEKYASTETTDITASVGADGLTDFKIELVD